MDIYRFQFKHMSEMTSYLKGKVLEQKQLLDYMIVVQSQNAGLTSCTKLCDAAHRDLEETRKENLALRREIQALRSPPIKTEDGSASDSSA
ncbi:hypothetical protein [Sporisorium scitamineum]|uniref:Uncharacterized protein n=1 Tax=Sporisorium scitamineum TaxID=49012 RepID=A0A0F7SCU5_9BASI|nr:hypothetical protein [Sporisorium scitamineum]